MGVAETVEVGDWRIPEPPREPLWIPRQRLWNHRLGLQHVERVELAVLDKTKYLTTPIAGLGLASTVGRGGQRRS